MADDVAAEARTELQCGQCGNAYVDEGACGPSHAIFQAQCRNAPGLYFYAVGAVKEKQRLDAELVRLRADNATLARERDLAIAHDRQPYPTAWAFEQACRVLEEQRERAERAEAEVATLTAERDEAIDLADEAREQCVGCHRAHEQAVADRDTAAATALREAADAMNDESDPIPDDWSEWLRRRAEAIGEK